MTSHMLKLKNTASDTYYGQKGKLHIKDKYFMDSLFFNFKLRKGEEERERYEKRYCGQVRIQKKRKVRGHKKIKKKKQKEMQNN